MPNGLSHLYQLDQSIFHLRGVWCTFFIFIILLIEIPVSKQCRPRFAEAEKNIGQLFFQEKSNHKEDRHESVVGKIKNKRPFWTYTYTTQDFITQGNCEFAYYFSFTCTM